MGRFSIRNRKSAIESGLLGLGLQSCDKLFGHFNLFRVSPYFCVLQQRLESFRDGGWIPREANPELIVGFGEVGVGLNSLTERFRCVGSPSAVHQGRAQIVGILGGSSRMDRSRVLESFIGVYMFAHSPHQR